MAAINMCAVPAFAIGSGAASAVSPSRRPPGNVGRPAAPIAGTSQGPSLSREDEEAIDQDLHDPHLLRVQARQPVPNRPFGQETRDLRPPRLRRGRGGRGGAPSLSAPGRRPPPPP